MDYLHSSAKFYFTGEQGIYPVTNSGELNDIDLTIKAIVRKSVSKDIRGVPDTGDSAAKEGIIEKSPEFQTQDSFKFLIKL